MPVTTQARPRLEYALSQKGTIYSKSYTLAAEEVGDPIVLPVNKIYAIGLQVAAASDLKIEATMASPAEIIAETAIWDTWDGTSLFNLAVTAIKATNNSVEAVGTFTLTVKGDI